jgi:hypothetical protein
MANNKARFAEVHKHHPKNDNVANSIVNLSCGDCFVKEL